MCWRSRGRRQHAVGGHCHPPCPLLSQHGLTPSLPPPQITVDGDTSTNDTVIGLASGAAGAAPITDAASTEGKALEAALTALLQVGAPY